MYSADEQLVSRTLAGDRDAFGELVQKYQQMVFAYAFQKLRNEVDAQDVMQEVFLRAYSKLYGLRHPHRFRSWLYAIMSNECNHWLARAAKTRRHQVQLAQSSGDDLRVEPAHTVSTEGWTVDLEQAISTLSDDNRVAVSMFYMGDCSLKEISEFLGVSVNTVKTKLHRARQQLGNALSERYGRLLKSHKLKGGFFMQLMEQIRDLPAPAMGFAWSSATVGKSVFALITALCILIGLVGGREDTPTKLWMDQVAVARASSDRWPVEVSLLAPADYSRRSSIAGIPSPTGERPLGASSRRSTERSSRSIDREATSDANGAKAPTPQFSAGIAENTPEKLTNSGRGPAQGFPQSGLPDGARLRLGNGNITEMQYSPDSTRLAVATGIGIWIYDAANRKEPVLLAAHEGGISCLAYSPDGNLLASGSTDNAVHLWNASTGAHLRALEGHTSRVIDVTFSRDGAALSSVDYENSVRIWDIATGEEQLSFDARTQEGMEYMPAEAVLSPDGSMLAAWNYRKKHDIDLWDISTGKHLRSLQGHTEYLTCVAFSPDGSMLASGSWRDSIRLWDVVTGSRLHRLEGTEAGVMCVDFSPDGSTLSTGHSDESTRIWDAGTGELLRTLGGHTDTVAAIAFSPDGGGLATADSTIRVWDSSTGERLHDIEGHFDSVNFVAISPDGATLASTGARQPIRVWDTVTGAYMRSLDYDHSLSPNFVFRPDGQTLVRGDDFHSIRLWDLRRGGELRTLVKDVGNDVVFAYSADGSMFASGDAVSSATLWDAQTGAKLRTLNWELFDFSQVVYRPIRTSLAFSPDGKLLASGSEDYTIRLFDTGEGTPVHILNGDELDIVSVVFSPDGGVLASVSGDNTVRLWDTMTGAVLHTLQPGTGALSVVFTPNGGEIATGGINGTIDFWDAESGKHQRALKGHGWAVTSLVFAPDGNTLVSGSGDGTILLWDYSR